MSFCIAFVNSSYIRHKISDLFLINWSEIFMNGDQLEELDGFKYLGVMLNKDWRSTTEIKTSFNGNISNGKNSARFGREKIISFPTKMKFYKFLFLLSTQLNGCENWTLIADTPKRVQTFETKCFRRLLEIKQNKWLCTEPSNTSVNPAGAPLLNSKEEEVVAWKCHTPQYSTWDGPSRYLGRC